jgi:hypothetical protein
MMVIETLLDLDTLSVDELIGRLKAAKKQYDLVDGSGGRASAGLNLTEDDLVACVASRH